jgi:SAM-dependent methyltransferase
MSVSNFYRAFEDLHRGSRELIQSRQEVYLPFVRGAVQLNPDAPVTDLGCGRGEWLELLQKHGIRAQGVDLDEGMLAACRERKLDVREGDAIAFLRQLPEASQAVVSGFHIAEHVPFETLQEMVSQALRVLCPGGLLILETPNPENLAVGTAGFYMDPTHERPLPAPLLAFLPQFHGFGRVKTLRLQEGPSVRGQAPVTLVDVLAGVSPDYAVVAQKPAGDAPAGHPAVAALDEAFARDYGVTLNGLAERHERQWDSRLHHAQGVAEEAARRAALASQAAASQAVEKAAALEHKVLTDMLALQNALLQAQRELQAVYHSRAWRMTRPLRWLREQQVAWREQGAKQRIQRLTHKAGRTGAHVAARLFKRGSLARRVAGRLLRLAGLAHFAARLRERYAGAEPVAETGPMTPEARRIHEALKKAVAGRDGSAGKKE